jgi:hypothetical protein
MPETVAPTRVTPVLLIKGRPRPTGAAEHPIADV